MSTCLQRRVGAGGVGGDVGGGGQGRRLPGLPGLPGLPLRLLDMGSTPSRQGLYAFKACAEF